MNMSNLKIIVMFILIPAATGALFAANQAWRYMDIACKNAYGKEAELSTIMGNSYNRVPKSMCKVGNQYYPLSR